VQVVYKGGGDAALAVLSREVDFNCGNLTSLIGNLKGGLMRALFTTTPERWPDIPDVPTVRELGHPGLEAIIGWSALYGPPAMPSHLVTFWREALAKVAADPQWIAGTERIGGHAQHHDAGRYPALRRRPVRAVRPDRSATRRRTQVGGPMLQRGSPQ
jgi:tripartite-type tricarboxylate transporter receptor subunit TctC